MKNSIRVEAARGAMCALLLHKHRDREVIVTDRFPSILDMPRTYLGAFVWTTANKRYMSKYHVTDIHGVKFSPADIAREYLTYKYDGQRRRTDTATYEHCFKPCHKSAPLFARQIEGDLTYVDIKAAYWNIIRTVGWDVNYIAGKAIGTRSDNEDFPYPDHKLARNILVTCGLPNRTQVWNGKRLVSVAGKNPLYNGILWCFAMDVLNTIAYQMVGAGAVYAHTDGYIFPTRDVHIAYDIAESWGLPLGVKYTGYGKVYGVANYWITGKSVNRPRPAGHSDFRKIDPVGFPDFLRRGFLKWREYRKLPIKSDRVL